MNLINKQSVISSHVAFGIIAGLAIGWLTVVSASINWKPFVERLAEAVFEFSIGKVLSALDKSLEDFSVRPFLLATFLGVLWGIAFFGIIGLASHYNLLQLRYRNGQEFIVGFTFALSYALPMLFIFVDSCVFLATTKVKGMKSFIHGCMTHEFIIHIVITF